MRTGISLAVLALVLSACIPGVPVQDVIWHTYQEQRAARAQAEAEAAMAELAEFERAAQEAAEEAARERAAREAERQAAARAQAEAEAEAVTAEIAERFVVALRELDMVRIAELTYQPGIIYQMAITSPRAGLRLAETSFELGEMGIESAEFGFFVLNYRLGDEVGSEELRVEVQNRRITNAAIFVARYFDFLEGR